MDNKISAAIIVAGGLLAAFLVTGHQPRQDWELKASNKPGMVNFSIERVQPGSRMINSMDLPLVNFRNLPSDAFDHSGKAQFEYVTDAGLLLCQGKFSWHKGAGSFRFEPNPNFGPRLQQLGYDMPDEDQLFAMLLTDLNLEFARGVKDAGLEADTRRLIELHERGVTIDYIRDAIRAGYKNFSAQDYIDMHDHGVDVAFLRETQAYQYDFSAHEIAELRDRGVSSEFLGDLKDAGYDLSAAQVVELTDHGVNSAYVRQLKDFELQPQASDLVELKNHGVSPDYLKGLKEAGYAEIAVNQITELRDRGVGTEFAGDARTLGYDFTPAELVELRAHGVDSDYLKHLHATGIKNLNAEQIEKLKTHGVE